MSMTPLSTTELELEVLSQAIEQASQHVLNGPSIATLALSELSHHSHPTMLGKVLGIGKTAWNVLVTYTGIKVMRNIVLSNTKRKAEVQVKQMIPASTMVKIDDLSRQSAQVLIPAAIGSDVSVALGVIGKQTPALLPMSFDSDEDYITSMQKSTMMASSGTSDLLPKAARTSTSLFSSLSVSLGTNDLMKDLVNHITQAPFAYRSSYDKNVTDMQGVQIQRVAFNSTGIHNTGRGSGENGTDPALQSDADEEQESKSTEIKLVKENSVPSPQATNGFVMVPKDSPSPEKIDDATKAIKDESINSEDAASNEFVMVSEDAPAFRVKPNDLSKVTVPVEVDDSLSKRTASDFVMVSKESKGPKESADTAKNSTEKTTIPSKMGFLMKSMEAPISSDELGAESKDIVEEEVTILPKEAAKDSMMASTDSLISNESNDPSTETIETSGDTSSDAGSSFVFVSKDTPVPEEFKDSAKTMSEDSSPQKKAAKKSKISNEKDPMALSNLVDEMTSPKKLHDLEPEKETEGKENSSKSTRRDSEESFASMQEAFALMQEETSQAPQSEMEETSLLNVESSIDLEGLERKEDNDLPGDGIAESSSTFHGEKVRKASANPDELKEADSSDRQSSFVTNDKEQGEDSDGNQDESIQDIPITMNSSANDDMEESEINVDSAPAADDIYTIIEDAFERKYPVDDSSIYVENDNSSDADSEGVNDEEKPSSPISLELEEVYFNAKNANSTDTSQYSGRDNDFTMAQGLAEAAFQAELQKQSEKEEKEKRQAQLKQVAEDVKAMRDFAAKKEIVEEVAAEQDTKPVFVTTDSTETLESKGDDFKMAQGLAEAAFHAELQKQSEEEVMKQREAQKKQVEEDVKAMRNHAAKKKIVKEVARQQNTPESFLLQRLAEKERRNKFDSIGFIDPRLKTPVTAALYERKDVPVKEETKTPDETESSEKEEDVEEKPHEKVIENLEEQIQSQVAFMKKQPTRIEVAEKSFLAMMRKPSVIFSAAALVIAKRLLAIWMGGPL